MNKDKFIKDCENELRERFEELDEVSFYNQKKSLRAFQNNNVELRHFYGSTGYGNSDVGRDTLNKVFAEIFGCESAVVSPLITCGTHALYLALSAVLRPGNKILSITGSPYDTLIDAINGNENGIYVLLYV